MADNGDSTNDTDEEKLKTQQQALQEVAFLLLRGFIVVIIIYLVSLMCLRSRKSWFDALAARRVSFVLKTLVVVALFVQLPLLYFYILYGSPVTLSEKDETFYWTFSWSRPVYVIVFLSFGLFADMHAGPRYLCLMGSAGSFFFDAISAVRVYLYYYQVIDHDAPLGSYTEGSLRFYFYRDMLSFCITVYITLMVLHLCAVVGWWQPPVINYQSIVGGEVDRLTVFQQQRQIRRIFDYKTGLEESRQDEKEEKRVRRKLNVEKLGAISNDNTEEL